MADWKKLLKDVLLADGTIDAAETKIIKAEIMADGVVDAKEVDFLVGLPRNFRSAGNAAAA